MGAWGFPCRAQAINYTNLLRSRDNEEPEVKGWRISEDFSSGWNRIRNWYASKSLWMRVTFLHWWPRRSRPSFSKTCVGSIIPVASGVVGTRKRIALALDCPETVVGKKFNEGITHPIPSKKVKDGPCKEVILKGDQVDLTRFPIPLLHEKDGGPYISGGVVSSIDPEYGLNIGMYRHDVSDEKRNRHRSRFSVGHEEILRKGA